MIFSNITYHFIFTFIHQQVTMRRVCLIPLNFLSLLRTSYILSTKSGSSVTIKVSNPFRISYC